MSLRAPPAYQEYASDLLANETVKVASLDELGLLSLMRWQCWVSDSIPVNVEDLARVLGREAADIRRCLTPGVLTFFAAKSDDSRRLECPELRDYKAEKALQRTIKSEAGRKGAESLHGKRGQGAKAAGNSDSNVPWQGAIAAPEKRQEEPKRNAKSVSIGKDDSGALVRSAEAAEYARAFADQEPETTASATAYRQATGR